METKEKAHITPGPWQVVKDGTRIKAGQFNIFLSANMVAYPDEWHANATAIAALPELIEALVQAQAVIENVHAQHPDELWLGSEYESIKAALRKAGVL